MDRRDTQALHELAKEIASELGKPWRYDVTESRDAHGELWCQAALKPGLSDYGVNVSVDWRNNNRLIIAGRIPSKDRAGNRHHTWHESQDGKRPEISVA